MTSLVMVRYEVAPERAPENEELVRDVFAELALSEPAGLGYATFVLDDGVSFVHLAALDPGDGALRLGDVAAFARFKARLGERVVSSPTRTSLRLVGSYRVLGG